VQQHKKFKPVFFSALGHNWPLFVVVMIFFILGVFFGTLGVNTLSPDNTSRLSEVIDSFISSAPELDNASRAALQNSLYDNLLTWGVIFFLGLTIIGIPMILFLVFMRGFALGFTISFLTGHKAEAGILVTLTAIIPHNLILIPALFVSGAASLSFAIILLKRFFNTQIRVLSNFTGYLVIMLLTGTAFAGAALVEALVNPWLTRMASSLLEGSWSFPF
jgi:stage II sporulation protein M